MTQADKYFKETCKEIIENGYSSEGTNVRTRWEDGTEANYISIVGVSNQYDVEKEFPMITLRNNSGTVKRAIDEVLWIWQKKSNNIQALNSHIWDQWAAAQSGSLGLICSVGTWFFPLVGYWVHRLGCSRISSGM